MTNTIEEYSQSCRHCLLRKAANRIAHVPTQRYPACSRPFERAHIDLIKLTKTTSGHEYVLVVKCALTQWVELIPLYDKSKGSIAAALFEEIYCRHGSVVTFVSDKGTEFVNETLTSMNKLLAQSLKSTTPYNPQANGKVENMNRTIKDMLTAYAHRHQKDWDNYLQVVAHGYRTTVNTATGYSPFRAMHGREARQPSEQWIQNFSRLHDVDIDHYVSDLAHTLQETWRIITEITTKKYDHLDRQELPTNAMRYIPYSVNEKFYLKSIPKRFYISDEGEKSPINAKLQYRYTGPHIILQQINPVTYKALVNGTIKTVHANKMKRDTEPNTIHIIDIPSGALY